MGFITVKKLRKEFKIYSHRPGFKGAFLNLFSRKFHLVKAVNDVSFEIDKGELVGYIGPNGAGKSTTIKMLTGILFPTSGEIKVNGFDPFQDRRLNTRQIGVVFGQRTALWWDLPIIESYDLLHHIYRIEEDRYKKRLLEIVDLLNLKEILSIPVRKLSLGQRMRADIGAALLHEPEVLFFDEPTIGLDISAKQKVREFIKEINQSNKVTVILTTHDLGDIQQLCKRVILIDHGAILFDGKLDDLINKYDSERILIADLVESDRVIGFSKGRLIKREGNRVWIGFNKKVNSASEVIFHLGKLTEIIDCQIKEPDIEGVIAKIYSQNE